MQKYDIPTAHFSTFDNSSEAKNYAKNNDSGNSFISLRWRGEQS